MDISECANRWLAERHKPVRSTPASFHARDTICNPMGKSVFCKSAWHTQGGQPGQVEGRGEAGQLAGAFQAFSPSSTGAAMGVVGRMRTSYMIEQQLASVS